MFLELFLRFLEDKEEIVASTSLAHFREIIPFLEKEVAVQKVLPRFDKIATSANKTLKGKHLWDRLTG